MNRPVLLVAAFLLASAALADTIPQLFQKTKDQVRAGSWSDALATMSTLEAEAAQPGNESVRRQLQAPLAFYRGVCQASLGQTEPARASFQTFLADQPNATMDPSMYSKRAVAAFESARKGTAGTTAAAVKAAGSPSLFNSFQEFKAPPNASDPPDDHWGDGPVRWIMTPDEKKAWAALSAGADREEFVAKFWESRNPNPGSPDNIFKTSFERRVAFADARFVQDEVKRGSMTDRGMVFVVLGPPTYGGRRPIKNGEDSSEAAGMSTVSSAQIQMAQASAAAGSPSGKISSGQAASIADAMSGPSTQAAESNNNYQEVWHYRKELLPKGVGYQQVDVVFITRKGYGSNVLQRDPATLTTLAAGKPQPAS